MSSNFLKMESCSEADHEESIISLTDTIKTVPYNKIPTFNFDFKVVYFIFHLILEFD